MPLSVAYSQKDKRIWQALEEKYNLTILEETSTASFKGCTPNIVMVSLNDKDKPLRKQSVERSSFGIDELTVIRGKVSMYLAKEYPGSVPLVHTTNLQGNAIEGLEHRVNYKTSTIQGPAVLVPRVGKPDKGKICQVPTGTGYAISDCVIAIRCATDEIATILFSFLLHNWEDFSRLYHGTAAHYVTCERISQFLNIDKTEPTESIEAPSKATMHMLA